MIAPHLHGRYRILAKLGEGGTDEVYLAGHLPMQELEIAELIRSAT